MESEFRRTKASPQHVKRSLLKKLNFFHWDSRSGKDRRRSNWSRTSSGHSFSRTLNVRLEHDKQDRSNMTQRSKVETRRLQPPSVRIDGLRKSQEERWGEIEDKLWILLDGNLNKLNLFHHLHNKGIQNAFLLESAAYLSTTRKAINEATYFDHISVIAAYLSVGRAKREHKLEVLRTLMTCLSPPEACWQIREAVIVGTLDFILCRSMDWEFMEHTENLLIWELRAMACCLLDREQKRVAHVARTADTAAFFISMGAMIVGEGVTRSGSVITKRIESTGVKVKGRIRTNERPLMVKHDTTTILAFSNAAKKVSSGANKTSKLAINGLRDASTYGLRVAATQFEGRKFGERISPEGRAALTAAGKISLATVGAVAIMSEALLETSRTVMEKTAVVTADVVQHKYGSCAGQFASDAGETTVNIFRTVGNVSAVSKAKAFANTITRSVGKDQAALEAEKARNALRILENHATNLFRTAIGNDTNTAPSCLESTSPISVVTDAEQDNDKVNIFNKEQLKQANDVTAAATKISLTIKENELESRPCSYMVLRL